MNVADRLRQLAESLIKLADDFDDALNDAALAEPEEDVPLIQQHPRPAGTEYWQRLASVGYQPPCSCEFGWQPDCPRHMQRHDHQDERVCRCADTGRPSMCPRHRDPDAFYADHQNERPASADHVAVSPGEAMDAYMSRFDPADPRTHHYYGCPHNHGPESWCPTTPQWVIDQFNDALRGDTGWTNADGTFEADAPVDEDETPPLPVVEGEPVEMSRPDEFDPEEAIRIDALRRAVERGEVRECETPGPPTPRDVFGADENQVGG